MPKKLYSFEQWCLDNNHEDWIDLWDYDLNVGVSPSSISAGTHVKYWFKCPRGLHDSFQKELRILKKGDSSVTCRKCSSIGQFLIDQYGEDAIMKMWSDKNCEDPFLVAKGDSKKHVWIKCPNNISHPDSSYKPISIFHGSRCRACSKVSVIPGYNDIFTVYPNHAKYFFDIELSKTVTKWSERPVLVVCPDCKEIFYKRPCDLISNPFSCPRCGDNSTYPNKFVREFIRQLQNEYNIDMFQEHVFDWSKNLDDGRKHRIYDFYLRYMNEDYVIEVHGEQHYNGSFGHFEGAKNLIDELRNDNFKKRLAINNGIKEQNYIEIDARKSDLNWIKKSIFDSHLNDIFNLKAVNWYLCDEMACKSLVKIAADLWNSGIKSTTKICEKIGRSRATTIKYLKRAKGLGMCDYDPSLSFYYMGKAKMLNNQFCSVESIIA